MFSTKSTKRGSILFSEGRVTSIPFTDQPLLLGMRFAPVCPTGFTVLGGRAAPPFSRKAPQKTKGPEGENESKKKP